MLRVSLSPVILPDGGVTAWRGPINVQCAMRGWVGDCTPSFLYLSLEHLCVGGAAGKNGQCLIYISSPGALSSVGKNVQNDSLPAQQCAVSDHKPGHCMERVKWLVTEENAS